MAQGGRGDTWRRARPKVAPAELNLPVSPAVLSEVQAAIRSDSANAAVVAAIIQKDPGLLAMVLRLVNSSYYGLPQRITRPAAAVAYLGLAEVLRVVVTAAIVQAFGPARHAGLRPLWRHASHTALIAQALTRRFARWLPAISSWTLGLLHDLGSFARLVSDSESQVRINHYTADYRCMAEEAELALELAPGPLIGRRLATQWRLPPAFLLVLGDHRDGLPTMQCSPDDEQHLRVVAAASALATLVSRPLRDDVRASLHHVVMSTLGLDEDELVEQLELADELAPEAEKLLAELIGGA